MRDYKKYINALRKCAKEHENDRTFTGHIIVSDLCRDTADLLEALEQEPKWIPVNERLPEDSGTYLITLKNMEVCLCDIDPEDFGDRAELNITAIAWMPFKPYKAESEDI